MIAQDDQQVNIFQRAYRRWVKLTGVDWRTWKLLFKSALAPTICLACYEARPWRGMLTSLGYLPAMAAIIAMPSLPRAKYIQLVLLETVLTCIGAALTALALYSVMKAREHTDGYTTQKPAPYNSSASAVAGIWLAVQTYLVSAARASHPRLIWPCGAWMILVVFGPIYAPTFGTMEAAMMYTKKLFLSMLLGLAIGSGVSIFIFPESSRAIFFESVNKSCGDIAKALRSYETFLTALADSDNEQTFLMLAKERNEDGSSPESTESLSSLYTKLDEELKYAQQEFSVGDLDRNDLASIHEHIRAIIVPLIGLGQLPGLFAESRAANCEAGLALIRAVHQKYKHAMAILIDSIEHIPGQLGLVSEAALFEDTKKTTNTVQLSPTSRTAGIFRQLQKELLMTKRTLLDTWHELPLERKRTVSTFDKEKDTSIRSSPRQQLDLLLFSEVLLYAVAMRLEELTKLTQRFGERRRTACRRIIVPGPAEWWNICSLDLIYSYTALQRRRTKTPHHSKRFNKTSLNTRWERNTAFLPAISRFFRSETATFAIRVTLANMSMGVVAFLSSSQYFYLSQHVVWGNYAIVIAMMPSVGQSFKFFLTRLLGTILGIVLAWISWYIVAGIPGGALVMFGIMMHIPMYILLLSPEWSNAGSVAALALTVVFGYQILVQAYGASNLERDGLAAHSTILEGAIRLAAISVGLLLAWIWTMFPYVVSEARLARRKLSDLLYSVSEYYYATHKWSEHTHVTCRLHDSADTPDEKEWARLLSKSFMRCTSHVEELQALLQAEKFAIDFGRRFPREQYVAITKVVDRLVKAIELAAFASATFARFAEDEKQSMSPEWIQTIQGYFEKARTSAETVPTLLAILSNFIANQAPLPPHLQVPEDVAFGIREPDHIELEILDVKHTAEPGFATLTVMYLATQQINQELILVVEHVKNVLGEVDYDDWTYQNVINQS